MILVFKVRDNTILGIQNHIVIHNLRCFKGTREDFNAYYTEHVGHAPKVDYMVYNKPEQVNLVTHGGCDGNVKIYHANREAQRIHEEKRYLKSSYR